MKRIMAVLGVIVLALLGVLLPATAASAHTPIITDTCDSISADLKYYEVIDGHEAVYKTEYEFAFKKDHPNSPRWEDEGWNADSNPNSEGWHSTGATRSVLVTEAVEGNATPNTITLYLDGVFYGSANFGHSYANTVAIDGSVAHTYSVVIDAVGTDYDVTINGETEACFVQPPQPDPIVTVSYTDWVDGEGDCETGTVSQSRGKTTTTQVSVWNEQTLVYDLAEPTSETVTEYQSREMTSDELDACAGPQPEDKVTVTSTEWVDGTIACDATTVEQTRETTTVTESYTLVDHEWTITASSTATVTEKQVRELTKDERTVCPEKLASAGDNGLLLLMIGLGAAVVGVIAKRRAA
jgi:hypothetical protein